MGYGKETLLKATQILESRRSKAQRIQLARHMEITEKIPEIATYEAKLAETGLAVVKAFGMGKDAQAYIEKLASINAELQNIIRQTLKANGYPENYLETPYHCPKCEDTGFCSGYICDCRTELLKTIAKTDLASVSQSANCTFENFNIDYYPLPADESTGVSAKKRMNEILEYCKNYAEDFLKLYQEGFLNMPWNKLFRKELAGRFDTSLSLGEDLLFNIDYLGRCRHAAVISDALIHYIQEEKGNTLSTKKRDDKLEIATKVCNGVQNYYEKLTGSQRMHPVIAGKFVMEFFDDCERLDKAHELRTRLEKCVQS